MLSLRSFPVLLGEMKFDFENHCFKTHSVDHAHLPVTHKWNDITVLCCRQSLRCNRLHTKTGRRSIAWSPKLFISSTRSTWTALAIWSDRCCVSQTQKRPVSRLQYFLKLTNCKFIPRAANLQCLFQSICNSFLLHCFFCKNPNFKHCNARQRFDKILRTAWCIRKCHQQLKSIKF